MSDDLQAIKAVHDKVKEKISLEDFQAKIVEKVKEHYGLLSEIGAAKLLAREMGATFESPPISFKIKNLVPGMQSVDVAGRVVRIYGVRNFDRATGSGKVSNLLLMDETGSVRVVLWGEKAEPVEKNTIKRGDIIEIRSGYTRTGLSGDVEVHVGRRGRVLVNPAVSEPMPELVETEVKVRDVKEGMRDVTISGVVSGVSNIRTFQRADGATGRVASLFLRDETGEIRVSLWNEKTDGIDSIQKGNSIRIAGAYSRAGFNDSVELHCSSSSEITIGRETPREIPDVRAPATHISDLKEGMQSVDLEGKVERVLGRRTFTRLNGQEGKVANLILGDGTGEVRLVLWGEAADLVEGLAEGSKIVVENAYTKMGMNQELEVHLGWRGRVIPKIEEFKPMICDLESGMENLDLKVGIVEIGLPEEFEDARLVSTVIGDESGRIPAVFWDGHVEVVKDLEPGLVLLLRDVKVNDLGEVHVLPEASVQVLEERMPVAGSEGFVTSTIGSLESQGLYRIRGAPFAITDLRETDSFGEKRLLCRLLVDDGSGQLPVVVFGTKTRRLFSDNGSPITDLRKSFQKGVDFIFTGLWLDGSLRVKMIEIPDPKDEIMVLMAEMSEEK